MPRNASSLSAEKPLQGAVLCCTSVLAEERTQLAEYAQEMGAEHTLDLTSDVTHLIVGDTESKKYQYVAKEREDVKVLRPEWVRAVREVWMADQPLDLNALDAEYRLPTLFGLKICITGFEDLAFRNGFAQDIQKNGGLYAGDLTKDVTHLIACTASGKKYEYATMWQIKIVGVKWYKDSLDRGMQLDESLYHPTLPAEQQGVGAWNRKSFSSPRLGKRAKEEQPKAETNRKLRRTASKRFGSQHQDIWNDIVGQNDRESTTDQATEGAIRPTNPMSHSLSSDAEGGNLSKHVVSVSKNTEGDVGILADKHFALKGFDEKRKELLFKALSGLKAHVHASVSEMIQHAEIDSRNQFLVVPCSTDTKYSRLLGQKCPNVRLVTELWVEWCITMKTFVDPDTYFLGRPVSPIVLPAVSKLTVNTTGFPPVQTMHISKLVSQVGARYQEIFTPDISVLVCNPINVNPQKVVHAVAWKIPVVTEKWLEQLFKQERIPSFENYKMLPNSKSTTYEMTTTASVDTSKQIHTTKARATIADVDGPYDCLEDSFGAAQDSSTSPEVMPAIEQHIEHNNGELPRSHNGLDQRAETTTIKTPQRVAHEQKNASRHLQELSTNIPAKQMPQPKKKMFRTLDSMQDTIEVLPAKNQDSGVAVVTDEDIENNNVGVIDTESESHNLPEHEKHDILMKEFFEIKAAAARNRAEINRRPSSSRTKENKLLGRALSNLSNSSRTSNDNGRDDSVSRRQNLSRASSIHSVITDGLGVPLSNISRLPSDPKGINVRAVRTDGGNKHSEWKESAQQRNTDASLQPLGSNDVYQDMSKLSSFHAQLLTFTNSQPVRAASPPPRSQDQGQLTYADTAEAVKLRAQLAEKRRARAKLDESQSELAPGLSKEESEERRQQEWQDMQRKLNEGGILRDDEALIGGGRRTRGRDKVLAGLESAKNVDDKWGAGVLI